MVADGNYASFKHQFNTPKGTFNSKLWGGDANESIKRSGFPSKFL